MMGMALSKKDRKLRLVVSREPNGRRQREPEIASSEIKRLRDGALRGLRDAEWGTEAGRLYLEGAITHTMYGATRRWTECVKKYHGAIGIFPVRSISPEAKSRTYQPDPDSEVGQKQAKRDREAVEQFFQAHAVLVMSGAESLVRRLCEQNEGPCGHQELIDTRRGLQRLVDHWALTNQEKRGVR